MNDRYHVFSGLIGGNFGVFKFLESKIITVEYSIAELAERSSFVYRSVETAKDAAEAVSKVTPPNWEAIFNAVLMAFIGSVVGVVTSFVVKRMLNKYFPKKDK